MVCPKNKDIPFQLTLLLAPFQPIFWWSSLSSLQYRIVLPDLVNDLEVFASEFSHKSTHSLEVNPYFFLDLLSEELYMSSSKARTTPPPPLQSHYAKMASKLVDREDAFPLK